MCAHVSIAHSLRGFLRPNTMCPRNRLADSPFQWQRCSSDLRKGLLLSVSRWLIIGQIAARCKCGRERRCVCECVLAMGGRGRESLERRFGIANPSTQIQSIASGNQNGSRCRARAFIAAYCTAAGACSEAEQAGALAAGGRDPERGGRAERGLRACVTTCVCTPQHCIPMHAYLKISGHEQRQKVGKGKRGRNGGRRRTKGGRKGA